MAKLSLNPIKGVTIKTLVRIRRTINGRRRTVPVELTPENYDFDAGVTRVGGSKYVFRPYDIRDLAKYRDDPYAFRLGNAAELERALSGNPYKAVTDIINRYNLTHIAQPVAYIYSSNSRVVRGTKSLMAVRLRDGTKGWLTLDGRFISQDDMRELLFDVDQTSPAAASDISLLDAWDSMSAQEKADLVDEMQDFDWDRFWEEIGSDDEDRDLGRATKAYLDLIDTIGGIMGWRGCPCIRSRSRSTPNRMCTRTASRGPGSSRYARCPPRGSGT